jgi:hypothetical protein
LVVGQGCSGDGSGGVGGPDDERPHVFPLPWVRPGCQRC